MAGDGKAIWNNDILAAVEPKITAKAKVLWHRAGKMSMPAIVDNEAPVPTV
jgi:hypothetical protein